MVSKYCIRSCLYPTTKLIIFHKILRALRRWHHGFLPCSAEKPQLADISRNALSKSGGWWPSAFISALVVGIPRGMFRVGCVASMPSLTGPTQQTKPKPTMTSRSAGVRRLIIGGVPRRLWGDTRGCSGLAAFGAVGRPWTSGKWASCVSVPVGAVAGHYGPFAGAGMQ